MSVFASIAIIIGCFIAGYIFLATSIKLLASRKYEPASIGFMLTIIVCTFLFKIILLL